MFTHKFHETSQLVSMLSTLVDESDSYYNIKKIPGKQLYAVVPTSMSQILQVM